MKVKIVAGGIVALDIMENGKLTADLVPNVGEDGEVEPILDYGAGMIVMFKTALNRGNVVNAETNEIIDLKTLPQEYYDVKRVKGHTSGICQGVKS